MAEDYRVDGSRYGQAEKLTWMNEGGVESAETDKVDVKGAVPRGQADDPEMLLVLVYLAFFFQKDREEFIYCFRAFYDRSPLADDQVVESLRTSLLYITSTVGVNTRCSESHTLRFNSTGA